MFTYNWHTGNTQVKSHYWKIYKQQNIPIKGYFQQLLQNAHNNSSHLPHSRRHSEVIKKFSLSLLLQTGSTGYQLLHKNMPEALDSLPTVQREAAKQVNPPSEWEFAFFDQLSVHLESYNSPRIVSISEDATGVITYIE